MRSTPLSIYREAKREFAAAIPAFQAAFEDALRKGEAPPSLGVEYPEVVLARTGVSLAEGAEVLLAEVPEPERELLLKAFAKDDSMARLLEEVHAEDPAALGPSTIYIGLCELPRGEWVHCDAHLGPHFAGSLALAALLMADRERGIDLCPAYACLAVTEAIRRLDRSLLLGQHEQRRICVGWDEGEARDLGSFTLEGWTWEDVSRG